MLRGVLLAAALAATPAHAAWRHIDLPKDATLRAVAVAGPRAFRVSGSKGTLGVTDDGGATWRLAAVAGGEALDFRGLAALDGKTLVVTSAGDGAAGQARIYRSADAGASWTLAFETKLPGSFLDAVAFRDTRNGLVLGDPVDGRWFLLRTTDGGKTWVRRPGPPVEPGEAAFAASNAALFLGPRAEIWIVSGGLKTARIFHSRDDGGQWDIFDAILPASATAGLFGGLALGKDRAVVVGGDYKNELAAGDGIVIAEAFGLFTPPHEGTPRLLEGVGRLNARTLIAVGPRGTSVSRDDGETWKQVDHDAFHAIACRAGTCVAAGAKGKVAVWRD
ncbi:MAG: hypothetical protein JNL41_03115 [Phenylobacterium sp.]|uniref:WD40/YVTN/BNR-like repeat-containing protein n=1 Tax=Phenylobacterium sp. TaxID=1871053 RepID=UPI001A5DBDB2|nr:hypothetical protein [Phenylobacterium sp.]MBL8553244.1 hypothetical protein [Phenylobacterium sp.]